MEMFKALFTVFSLIVAITPVAIGAVMPIVIGASDDSKSCASSVDLVQSARRNLTEAVLQALHYNPTSCGGIGWTPVVDLDMSDPSQQCPSPWRRLSKPGRCSQSSSSGCQGVNFAVPLGNYTKVCGRVSGYALGSPDAFYRVRNIESTYLDGVSLTYDSPRQHIWSFAAGYGANTRQIRCPCESTDRREAPLPPSFVGDNYFCDRAFNGALWDGQGCSTDCCTFNSPPYFTATLPAPTCDDIEVRICWDEGYGNEAVHIGLLQLYVQ